MKKTLKIKQATAKGYVEVEEMGCFNAAYPTSDTRRGRVIEGGVLLQPSRHPRAIR